MGEGWLYVRMDVQVYECINGYLYVVNWMQPSCCAHCSSDSRCIGFSLLVSANLSILIGIAFNPFLFAWTVHQAEDNSQPQYMYYIFWFCAHCLCFEGFLCKKSTCNGARIHTYKPSTYALMLYPGRFLQAVRVCKRVCALISCTQYPCVT